MEKRSFDIGVLPILYDTAGDFIKKKLKRYPRAAKTAQYIPVLAAGAAVKPTYDYIKRKSSKKRVRNER